MGGAADQLCRASPGGLGARDEQEEQKTGEKSACLTVETGYRVDHIWVGPRKDGKIIISEDPDIYGDVLTEDNLERAVAEQLWLEKVCDEEQAEEDKEFRKNLPALAGLVAVYQNTSAAVGAAAGHRVKP